MKTVLTAIVVFTCEVLWVGEAVQGQDVRSDKTIELSTRQFRLRIHPDGRCAALIDLRDGKDYLSDKDAPYASLVHSGRTYHASAVRRDGNMLDISFGTSGICATIRVRENLGWITFEVAGLSDEEDIEQLTFLQARVTLPEGRHAADHRICVQRVRNQRLAVSCQALNLQTESVIEPLEGGDTLLVGRCHARFGLKGARVAFFAVPTDEYLAVIEAMELAEGLPHPTLDGVWAKRSPDARTSYLFIDMTEENADEVIQLAKDLNFGYILIFVGYWSKYKGSYEIDTRHYPHGMQGLKQVTKKAHAAGIKVGIHCLNGFVYRRDPLVTPVPDRRFATDGQVTLAADITADEPFIPTVQSPADFPSDVAYGLERQGFDVRIDDEIISYRGLSTEPPFGLLRCIRGAHRTRKAPHKKGAAVWHLTQRNNHYLVDCDTDLAQQVAARYAEVINTCKLDMIYFDGGFSNRALGEQYDWRYVPQIALQSAALWEREVRVGGAVTGSLFWHLKSFVTCNDFVGLAAKRFFEEDKLSKGRAGLENEVPVDLGWWGLHSWAPHYRSTTPDEIEYVCQKALAYGAFWSLETWLDKIHGCGRWSDIKRTIATYERLRLADYFDESVKQAIREPGAEFKLVGSDNAGWRLLPARYGPSHLVLDRATSTWDLNSDLPDQPLRFRLYALPTLAPYDSAKNPVLIDQSDVSKYVKSRSHEGCRTHLRSSDEKTPVDENCLAFHGASGLNDDGGWVEHRADLIWLNQEGTGSALIEGTQKDAAEMSVHSRPLGLWVHGDGKGEVLNVQLRSANGGFRDHYVDVDFTGWKYCELTQPESDRVFDFDAGYSRKHAVRHFQYDRLAFLYLRYNSIPAGAEVKCLVGPVRSLREHWLPVKDPAFAIAGRKIVFPCRLETEQYLEFDGQGSARLFDREGVEIARVAPTGQVPFLHRGANEITFSSHTAPEYSNRVDLTVIRFGEKGANR